MSGEIQSACKKPADQIQLVEAYSQTLAIDERMNDNNENEYQPGQETRELTTQCKQTKEERICRKETF